VPRRATTKEEMKPAARTPNCSGAKEEPLLKRNLIGSGMLVDVFFLCVVEAHKGLYRLDNALRIAN
jgi:hypothetical protein